MSHREPIKSGDFSLGLTHEFINAFGRRDGNPKMLQRLTENPVLMHRIVQCMKADGVFYPYSAKESEAVEILGPDKILNPSLTLLAWPDAKQVKNPLIPYSVETLMSCAEMTKENSGRYDWRLVYVHGFSFCEQKKYHENHFESGPESVKRFWKENRKAEWMTFSFPSGYYLINHELMFTGGKDCRKAQDDFVQKNNTKFARLPISVLSEILISQYYAFGGEKHVPTYRYWSEQVSASGNFVTLGAKLSGDVNKRYLEINIHDEIPGSPRYGGTHGLIIYQKPETSE
jgi:hypothetical protein